MAHDVNLNVTLTSSGEQAVKRLESLKKITTNVEVVLGKDITTQIQEQLNAKTFHINKLSLDKQALTGLTSEIQSALSGHSFHLDKLTITPAAIKAAAENMSAELSKHTIKLTKFEVDAAAINSISASLSEKMSNTAIKLNKVSIPQESLNQIVSSIRKALAEADLKINVSTNVHAGSTDAGAHPPAGSTTSSPSGKGTYLGVDIDGSKPGSAGPPPPLPIGQQRGPGGRFTGNYIPHDPYNFSGSGTGGVRGAGGPGAGGDVFAPAYKGEFNRDNYSRYLTNNAVVTQLIARQQKTEEAAYRTAELMFKDAPHLNRFNSFNSISLDKAKQNISLFNQYPPINDAEARVAALFNEQIRNDSNFNKFNDIYAKGSSLSAFANDPYIGRSSISSSSLYGSNKDLYGNLDDVGAAIRKFNAANQDEELIRRFAREQAAEESYRRRRQEEDDLNRARGLSKFSDLDSAREGLRNFNGEQRDRQTLDYQFRRSEARERAGLSFFADRGKIAAETGIPESELGPRRFFDSSRIARNNLGGVIGRDALTSLVNGQGLVNTGFEVVGSLAGGSIGPELASLGGAAGIATALAFEKLGEALKSAAEAGFTFQRSILGIASTYLQITDVLDPSGNPLSTRDQIEVQNKRARALQLQARSAFAEVGIGGSAESSIVQSAVNAFGSRGLALSDDTLTKITQGTGAAINILAPELANNPAVLRRDIFDIYAGLGQAGRTALGSRTPRLVRQLTSVETEDDAIRVFENELKPLIDTFKNSRDAVTQVSRFNAELEQLQSKFGTAFVDQLGPSIKTIADAIADPRISSAAQQFGKNIGEVTAGLVTLGTVLANLASIIDKFRLPEFKLPNTEENGIINDTVNFINRPEKRLEILGRAYERANLIASGKSLDEADRILSGGSKDDPNKQFNVRTKPELAIAGALNRIGGKEVGLEGEGEILSLPSIAGFSKGTIADRLFQINKIDSQLPLLNTDPESAQIARTLRNNAALGASSEANKFFQTQQGIGVFGDLNSARNRVGQFSGDKSLLEDNVRVAREAVASAEFRLDRATSRDGVGKISRKLGDVGSTDKETLDKIDNLRKGTSVQSAERALFSATGLLEKAEEALGNRRRENAKNIDSIIAGEDQLAKLRSAAIDRTTSAGRLQGLSADTSNLRSRRDNLLSAADNAQTPEDAARLRLEAESLGGSIAQSEQSERLAPIQEAQGAISLAQSANGAAQAMAGLQLRTEGLDLSIAKVNTSLESLERRADLQFRGNAEKAVGLLKEYQSKGGLLDNEILGGFKKAFGDFDATNLIDEASGGDGPFSFYRKQSLAKANLTNFLADNSKENVELGKASEKNALLTQKQSLENERKNAPLQFLQQQLQQADSLSKLAEFDPSNSTIAKAAAKAREGVKGFFKEDGSVDLKAIQDKIANPDASNPLEAQAGGAAATGGKTKADAQKDLNGSISSLTTAISTLAGSVDALEKTVKTLPAEIKKVFST